VVAHVVEKHAWNHARRMTRQRAAGGIDQQQLTSPAAHASFGKARVVIGDDHVDAHLAAQTLLGCGNHGYSTSNCARVGSKAERFWSAQP